MTASATSADRIVFMAVSSRLTNPAEMRDEGRLVRVYIVPMLRGLIFCIVCCRLMGSCSATPYANGAVPAGLYLPACSRVVGRGSRATNGARKRATHDTSEWRTRPQKTPSL